MPKIPFSNFLKKYLPMVISFSSLRGKTAKEAADDIVNNHIPKLKELGRNGEIHVDNIDVFCEKGVFDRSISFKGASPPAQLQTGHPGTTKLPSQGCSEAKGAQVGVHTGVSMVEESQGGPTQSIGAFSCFRFIMKSWGGAQ